jgi:hypothetical protein
MNKSINSFYLSFICLIATMGGLMFRTSVVVHLEDGVR